MDVHDHDQAEAIESIEVHYNKDSNVFVFIMNDDKAFSITPRNYVGFVNCSVEAINDVINEYFKSSMRRFLKPKKASYKSTSEEAAVWLKKQQQQKRG